MKQLCCTPEIIRILISILVLQELIFYKQILYSIANFIFKIKTMTTHAC